MAEYLPAVDPPTTTLFGAAYPSSGTLYLPFGAVTAMGGLLHATVGQEEMKVNPLGAVTVRPSGTLAAAVTDTDSELPTLTQFVPLGTAVVVGGVYDQNIDLFTTPGETVTPVAYNRSELIVTLPTGFSFAVGDEALIGGTWVVVVTSPEGEPVTTDEYMTGAVVTKVLDVTDTHLILDYNNEFVSSFTTGQSLTISAYEDVEPETVTVTLARRISSMTVTRTAPVAHALGTTIRSTVLADEFAVQRAQNGTTAGMHPPGTRVTRMLSSADFATYQLVTRKPVSCVVYIAGQYRNRAGMATMPAVTWDARDASNVSVASFEFTASFFASPGEEVFLALISGDAKNNLTASTSSIDLLRVADGTGVPIPNADQPYWTASGPINSVLDIQERHSGAFVSSSDPDAYFRLSTGTRAGRSIEILQAGHYLAFVYGVRG